MRLKLQKDNYKKSYYKKSYYKTSKNKNPKTYTQKEIIIKLQKKINIKTNYKNPKKK